MQDSSPIDDSQKNDPLINLGLAKLVGVSEIGQGTFGARLDTYIQVWNFLPKQGLWLRGAGAGTDILYKICTGIQEAPEQTTMTQNGQRVLLPKCAVDSSEAASTLRDPHNWILNIVIHHGIIGLLVFALAVLGPKIVGWKHMNSTLPAIGVFAYFLNGLFGVIISTPFAMLPIAVLLASLVLPRQEVELEMKLRPN